jgi:hypothetical protein
MKNGLEIDSYGNKWYYKDDEYHREDGPAIECSNGYKSWYINGKRHRIDGPALEYSDGNKYWYLDDKQIYCKDNEEFLKYVSSKTKMTIDNLIQDIKLIRKSRFTPYSVAEFCADMSCDEKVLLEKLFQLYTSEIEEIQEPIKSETPLTNWKQRQTTWQSNLINHLSYHYECEGVIGFDQFKNLGYFVIGTPDNIAILKMQYNFIVSALVKLADMLAPSDLSRGGGKSWHKAFYMDAITKIVFALKEAKRTAIDLASNEVICVINKHATDSLNLRENNFK